MKVRFLQDYRGYLTDERFFEAGSEADLPSGSDLVAAGRAEPVEEPVKEEPKPEPKPAPKKRGRAKKATAKK